jgi:thioredoxin-like negative regulator of GroEL
MHVGAPFQQGLAASNPCTTRMQALPTMVLFYKGKPIDRVEGLPSEAELLRRVQAKIQGLGV